MKRSNMEQDIIDCIFDDQSYIENRSLNETDVYILANRILNEIEKSGMLPPLVDKLPELTSFGKFLEKIGFKFRRYAYEYESVNEWESEE